MFFWYWVIWAAYIFWRGISLVSCFDCNYFLSFWGLSFHLVYSLLCCAKAFTFNYVPCIYVFISINLGGGSERNLLQFVSKSVLPMFSSKSFIISDFPFMSLIHFEFILVDGIRNFFFSFSFTCSCPVSPHHLLKRLSCFYFIFLSLFLKISWA